MTRGHRHLTDDRLIELCLDRAAAAEDQQHLQCCTRCEARRADLVRILDELSAVAAHETDAAFPPERLARQSAHIIQRIDHAGRPARVIVFPAGGAQEPWTPRRRPAMRWLAAAAVAGLLVGLLAGHFAHRLPESRTATSRQARPDPSPALRAATVSLSDDEFLGQIDTALARPSPAVLTPLDELTPLAWEAAAR
jgi:hypothetical protein